MQKKLMHSLVDEIELTYCASNISEDIVFLKKNTFNNKIFD